MYHANVNANLMEESEIQIKVRIIVNVKASVRNIIYVRKDYVWNPTTFSCENGKYFANFIDYSVITCDEIKEETKTVPTNFNEKKVTCKTQNLYFTCIFIN